MAALTLDQLLASFPDNNTGQIKPLDMRNFVQSVELKYDNWVIVKPGQPEGNKFPTPVSGKINLPVDTVWVINGDITLGDTLVCDNNVQIISLSGSFTADSILLDLAAGAIPLFENVAAASLSIRGLQLDLQGGSGRLFNFSNTGTVIVASCAVGNGSLGNWAGGENTLFEDCIFIVVMGSLFFTGAHTRISFVGNNFLGGIFGPGANQIDFTGTSPAIVSLQLTRNTADIDGPFDVFVVTDDNTADVGLIGLNISNETSTGVFLRGVTNLTGIKFTFESNVGIDNTDIFGGLGIRDNAVVTTNPGVNLWALAQGTTTPAEDLIRWRQPSNFALEYIGLEPFKGLLTLTSSVFKTGGGTETFELTIFKNATIFTNNGIEYVATEEFSPTDIESMPLVVPIDAVTGDIFDVRIRTTTTSSDDATVVNLQMVVNN